MQFRKASPGAFACAAVAFFLTTGTAEIGGDPEAGKVVFQQKCAHCHSTGAGAFKIGPPLGGVYGRKAGSADFSGYYGLEGADFVWDEMKLDRYLANPKKFLGGKAGMPVEVPDAQARADVIAYLKTLK